MEDTDYFIDRYRIRSWINFSDICSAAVDQLPTLKADAVPTADSCPICLIPFTTLLEEEKECVPPPTDRNGAALSGVTRLDGCGHLFCRKDLIEWMRSRHGSCPVCRNVFFELAQPDSEDESSDGGEYIPVDDDDEDDEMYFDTDISEAEWMDEMAPDERDDDPAVGVHHPSNTPPQPNDNDNSPALQEHMHTQQGAGSNERDEDSMTSTSTEDDASFEYGVLEADFDEDTDFGWLIDI